MRKTEKPKKIEVKVRDSIYQPIFKREVNNNTKELASLILDLKNYEIDIEKAIRKAKKIKEWW